MTITYSGEVPNGSSFGCFWKILWKWRGSVYKLVWRELVAYLVLYYTLNLTYRFALNDEQKTVFRRLKDYFATQSETIPMSFVLGFYVTLVVNRWWAQYKLLPWPDTLALYINAGIPGNDERQRLMRRNVVRYAILAYVCTLKRVSLRVKRRFPTWQHVVDAGIMMESEKKIMENMDVKSPMSKYWMPLVWATNIINRARKESLITSDHIVQTLLMELSEIRRRLGALIGYDTVCVPLVYTQVVTLALYFYFVAALLGRQMIPDDDLSNKKIYEDDSLHFPFFTALQFCFYVGWLKVAEVLINPFGEDDDDIELNWLIDRHLKAAYMIVDEMHEEHPELLRDQYWDEVVPKNLPYTVASEHYRREEPKGSAELYKVKTADAMYANITPARKNLGDDMYADYESVDTPIVERRKNWFARQITRMGSARSHSTAYSSGLFGRARVNSVYSTPDTSHMQNGGGTAGGVPVSTQKMSLYDRIVGRKSGRNQPKIRSVQKNRPRIPTPDVTKEVIDRERFGQIVQQNTNLPPNLALMNQQMFANQNSPYPSYNATELPVVQVVLSPIKELDGPSSVNSTLSPNSPRTAALAQAILPPTLSSAGIGPVHLATPVAMMSASSSMPKLQAIRFQASPHNSLTVGSTRSHNSTPNTISLADLFNRDISVINNASNRDAITMINESLANNDNTSFALTDGHLDVTQIKHETGTERARKMFHIGEDAASSLKSDASDSGHSGDSRANTMEATEDNEVESMFPMFVNIVRSDTPLKDEVGAVTSGASDEDSQFASLSTSQHDSLNVESEGKLRKISTVSQSAMNGTAKKREVYV